MKTIIPVLTIVVLVEAAGLVALTSKIAQLSADLGASRELVTRMTLNLREIDAAKAAPKPQFDVVSLPPSLPRNTKLSE